MSRRSLFVLFLIGLLDGFLPNFAVVVNRWASSSCLCENEGEKEECWKNTENHSQIYIMRNEGEWKVEDEDGDWIVTGENSLLYVEESFEEAKEKAVEWMLDTPKPSSMV